MLKLADLIEENVEELAAIDAMDAANLYSLGKILYINNGVELFRYYAGAADKIHGETLKMSKELQGYTLKEPIGVVGHIIPWNFPTQMFCMKVAPALAAGCTMVVKPAEQTPLSALFYAHLANQVHHLLSLYIHNNFFIYLYKFVFESAGWCAGWGDQCCDRVWIHSWCCNQLPHGH